MIQSPNEGWISCSIINFEIDNLSSLPTRLDPSSVSDFANLLERFSLQDLLDWKDPDHDYTLIHKAVQADNCHALELLIKKGMGRIVSKPDKYHQTPLHWAVGQGNLNICKILINEMRGEGCKIQTLDNLYTILHLAVQSEKAEVVQLLLSYHNCDELLGMQDKYGQTALHWAASNANTAIADTLIDKMEAKDLRIYTYENRYTALHLAVHCAEVGIITKLLEKDGSELAKMVDRYGQTALHWACSIGSLPICKILVGKMGLEELKIKTNGHGYTALHMAVQSRSHEIVKLLLGIDCNNELAGIVDAYKQTAKDWAIAQGEERMDICFKDTAS